MVFSKIEKVPPDCSTGNLMCVTSPQESEKRVFKLYQYYKKLAIIRTFYLHRAYFFYLLSTTHAKKFLVLVPNLID